MNEISNLSAFVKVVEKESFTAAAFALNSSPSSVSKKINQLEHEVGAKLLNRSTHGMVSLTEAGAIYFERVSRIIYDLESAKESVRDAAQSLQGKLKVHITPGTGLRIALPAILNFMKAYPSILVEISARPEVYNVLQQGFDVSVHSGSVHDSGISDASVEARELVKALYTICASPSYFEKHGKPAHPRDLATHNCLVSARQHSPDKWSFRIGQEKLSVNVRGSLVADNWTIIYEAAKAGLGIARMLHLNSILEPDGLLDPIFSNLVISDRSVWALIPRMDPVPRKIDLFLKFLSEEMQRQLVAGVCHAR
jgi:DNA-binding transcriptional LysR family regulator